MPEIERQYLRIPADSRVFIELVAAGADGADSGEILICKTCDVSRRGLRISLDQELVTGAILQIGVESPGSGNTLYFAGEVRWCVANKAPEQGWSAGFSLLNANDSDIDYWDALLAAMEP